MNRRKDILNVFKMNENRHHHFFDGSSNSFLIQWIFILCFGLVLTTAVVFWSVERFNYWAGLEERVDREEVTGSFYDQKGVRAILDDYEDRAERSESILNSLVLFQSQNLLNEDSEIETDIREEVSTTTETLVD